MESILEAIKPHVYTAAVRHREQQATFATQFKVFLLFSHINSGSGMVEEILSILVEQSRKLIVFLMLGHFNQFFNFKWQSHEARK